MTEHEPEKNQYHFSFGINVFSTDGWTKKFQKSTVVSFLQLYFTIQRHDSLSFEQWKPVDYGFWSIFKCSNCKNIFQDLTLSFQVIPPPARKLLLSFQKQVYAGIFRLKFQSLPTTGEHRISQKCYHIWWSARHGYR